MTAFIVVFILGLVLLALFVYAVRGQSRQVRSMEDFRARWQKVDVEAFANLVDPSEERFLRESLPAAEFRTLQRHRARVALEYLGRVARNAQLMVQAGQIIERHNSGAEAERARAHVLTAMRLRNQVFMARLALATQYVFPVGTRSLEQVLRSYSEAAHSFDNALDPSVAAVTM